MTTPDRYCSTCTGTGKRNHPWGKAGTPRWWYCEDCNGTGLAATAPGVGLLMCLLSSLVIVALTVWYWKPWR